MRFNAAVLATLIAAAAGGGCGGRSGPAPSSPKDRIAALRFKLAGHPHDRGAHLELARLYLGADRPGAALRHFTRAGDLGGRDREALIELLLRRTRRRLALGELSAYRDLETVARLGVPPITLDRELVRRALYAAALAAYRRADRPGRERGAALLERARDAFGDDSRLATLAPETAPLADLAAAARWLFDGNARRVARELYASYRSRGGAAPKALSRAATLERWWRGSAADPALLEAGAAGEPCLLAYRPDELGCAAALPGSLASRAALDRAQRYRWRLGAAELTAFLPAALAAWLEGDADSWLAPLAPLLAAPPSAAEVAAAPAWARPSLWRLAGRADRAAAAALAALEQAATLGRRERAVLVMEAALGGVELARLVPFADSRLAWLAVARAARARALGARCTSLAPPAKPSKPLAASSSSPGGRPRLRRPPCQRLRGSPLEARSMRNTLLGGGAGDLERQLLDGAPREWLRAHFATAAALGPLAGLGDPVAASALARLRSAAPAAANQLAARWRLLPLPAAVAALGPEVQLVTLGGLDPVRLAADVGLPDQAGPLSAIARAYDRDPALAERLATDWIDGAVAAAERAPAMVELFRRAGDPERADRVARILLDADPDDPQALLLAAETAAAMGQGERADVLALRAAARSGDAGTTMRRATRSFLAAGALRGGLVAGRWALSVTPPGEDLELLEIVARTMLTMGRRSQADEVLAELERRFPEPAREAARRRAARITQAGGAPLARGAERPVFASVTDPRYALARADAHRERRAAILLRAAAWNPTSPALLAALAAGGGESARWADAQLAAVALGGPRRLLREALLAWAGRLEARGHPALAERARAEARGYSRVSSRPPARR